MQNETYENISSEISELISKLNILSKSGNLLLQEYQSVTGKFLENCAVLKRRYDDLAFELVRKFHEAEEFLNDQELDRLKKAVGSNRWRIFLSQDYYQLQDHYRVYKSDN